MNLNNINIYSLFKAIQNSSMILVTIKIKVCYIEKNLIKTNKKQKENETYVKFKHILLKVIKWIGFFFQLTISSFLLDQYQVKKKRFSFKICILLLWVLLDKFVCSPDKTCFVWLWGWALDTDRLSYFAGFHGLAEGLGLLDCLLHLRLVHSVQEPPEKKEGMVLHLRNDINSYPSYLSITWVGAV